jgi:Inner membrane protein YgaP-like, transmembrane domain
MKIKKNLGVLDRILRTGIISAIIYFGFFDNPLVADPLAGTILGLFGVANLIVALAGNCPMYSLVNFNTCRDEKSSS